MWIRKSDLEIKNLITRKELKKKSLNRPIIVGTISGLLFMILTYLGFRGGSFRAGVFLFSNQTGFNFRTISAGIFGFILFFSISLYLQRRCSSMFSDNTYLRCDTCKEISHINPQNICPCGGKLELSEFYDWNEA